MPTRRFNLLLAECLKEHGVMLIPSSIRSTISVKRSGKKANNEFKQGLSADQCDTRPHPASVNTWLAHLIVSAEDFISRPEDYFNSLINPGHASRLTSSNFGLLETNK